MSDGFIKKNWDAKITVVRIYIMLLITSFQKSCEKMIMGLETHIYDLTALLGLAHTTSQSTNQNARSIAQPQTVNNQFLKYRIV